LVATEPFPQIRKNGTFGVMNLALFLRELLLEHDCVVMPGFGGLVANYRHARLNRVSHVIYPPAKQIAFNRNLSQNDGLLYKHVSDQLGISYAESREMVDRYTAALLNRLGRGEQLALDGIGVFFQDSRRLIQFIPSEQENFLLASYGLHPVQLVPIVAEKPVSEEVIPEEESVRTLPVPTRNWAWKVAAGIAIPLLLATGWLAGEQLFGHSNQQQFSFRFWDWNQKPAVYSPRVEHSKAEVLPAIAEEPLATETASVTASETISKEDTPAPDSNVSSNAPGGNLLLIAGAFQVEANADNLIQQLQAKGIQASRAGMRGPLHLVSVGSFSDRQRAKEVQSELKNSQGLKCWIYAK
jgi:cell division septation protein DedD/nucleoid DNA-binding protein